MVSVVRYTQPRLPVAVKRLMLRILDNAGIALKLIKSRSDEEFTQSTRLRVLCLKIVSGSGITLGQVHQQGTNS